ncbi:MAG TPA: zinc ribbon domain-containing protein [Nitrososphaerales archaeon]|nr:zinc ribbon domain-containing protein [Nitrososphaerales archaeon]
MSSVTYCSNCGKEIPAGALYCSNCGAKAVSTVSQGYWQRDHSRRARRREEDGWWGAVRALGFLAIIVLTIVTYPNVFSLIADYFRSFVTYGHPVLPPYSLGQVIIFFFNVSGIWGLIAAGLRFAFTNSYVRAAQDVAGALFALYIARTFTEFYARAFGGWGLLGYLALGLVGVIIASALIGFAVPRVLRSERVPQQPPPCKVTAP